MTDLLDDLEVDLVGLAAASVLLGIGEADQPGPAECAEDVTREAFGGLVGGGPGCEGTVGDLPGQVEQFGRLLAGQQTGHVRRHEFVSPVGPASGRPVVCVLCRRSRERWIFPLGVLGSWSVRCTARG